ncbi:MAG: M23 family metallopeptidase [Proteobacteria bacterium]|nr:M23 family metallopeptidase [Pseudomonadota bacterium]
MLIHCKQWPLSLRQLMVPILGTFFLVMIFASCKNKAPQTPRYGPSVPPSADPPPSDDVNPMLDEHKDIFQAKVLRESTAMDYTGRSCDLAEGTEFNFKTYMDENIDTVEFSITEPIEGCDFDKYFFIAAKDVQILSKNSDQDDVGNFPYIVGDKSFPSIISQDRPTTTGQRYFFPLKAKPIAPYTTGGRQFGAVRVAGGRRHAAVDLLTRWKAPVRAVTSGTILDAYPFYQGTYAIVVDHDRFVVRYGEVAPVRLSKVRNKVVKAGDVIGYVGVLYSGASMLHFEQYSGSKVGQLTVSSNHPYHRRADLVNPTSFIQELERRFFRNSR